MPGLGWLWLFYQLAVFFVFILIHYCSFSGLLTLESVELFYRHVFFYSFTIHKAELSTYKTVIRCAKGGWKRELLSTSRKIKSSGHQFSTQWGSWMLREGIFLNEAGLNQLICQVLWNTKIKLIRLLGCSSTLFPCHPPKHLEALDLCLELFFKILVSGLTHPQRAQNEYLFQLSHQILMHIMQEIHVEWLTPFNVPGAL